MNQDDLNTKPGLHIVEPRVQVFPHTRIPCSDEVVTFTTPPATHEPNTKMCATRSTYEAATTQYLQPCKLHELWCGTCASPTAKACATYDALISGPCGDNIVHGDVELLLVDPLCHEVPAQALADLHPPLPSDNTQNSRPQCTLSFFNVAGRVIPSTYLHHSARVTWSQRSTRVAPAQWTWTS